MKSIDDGAFRQGWLLANIWLLFLVFPAISVVIGDLGANRKSAALGLLGVFALTHMFAYTNLIRHELGLQDEIGLDRSRFWFAALVVINGAAILVGSWPMLAVLPFIVSFAMFHFSWRTGAIVCLCCLAMVLLPPLLGGVLGETWFFSILVVSVAAATAMTRLNEESHLERGELLQQLAVSREQDRVARDVHDVLGHSLTVVILKAQVCDRLLASLATEDQGAVEQARAQLAEVESVSRSALTEIRATVVGLRTADLADELAAARVVLSDARVELVVNGEAHDLSADERSVLGWVVREAVTNIVRHAQATQCHVDLRPTATSVGEQVLLRISDNGVGLGQRASGNGLAGLQERVNASGATLRIASHGGTTIEVLK